MARTGKGTAPPTRTGKLTTHLFRGVPEVRGWSKYQKTDFRWTLCGTRINWRKAALCVQAMSEKVTCRFCQAILLTKGGSIGKGSKRRKQ